MCGQVSLIGKVISGTDRIKDMEQKQHSSLTIYWVRHTAVDPKYKIICYGHTDVELSSTFPQEAPQTRKQIEHLKPDAVFSSPLTRALKLAQYCCPPPQSITVDAVLKELNFGEWEMKPWDEIIGEEHDFDFFRPYLTQRVPGGECVMDQYNRILDFIGNQMPDTGHRTLLVFCHGGVINAARAIAGETLLRNAFSSLPPYGSVTPIRYTQEILQKAICNEQTGFHCC